MIKITAKSFVSLAAILIMATGFTSKTETLEFLENSSYSNREGSASLPLYYTVLDESEMKEEESEVPFSLLLGKSFVGFKEALGFKESRGKYQVVNEFGYLGKYQFGRATLRVLGVYDSSSFIGDPSLQEKVFEANLARNKWVLRRDIERFSGKVINGVHVTESGILAAAHLGGPGSVKKFLRSYGRNVFSDAYGSSVKFYMKKFGGYDTSSIEAVKNIRVKMK